MIYDLAELYFKLGQLDNAERILVNALKNGKSDTTELNQLMSKTKLLQLLAKVCIYKTKIYIYIYNLSFLLAKYFR